MQISISIAPLDIVALADLPLKWRWANPDHNALTESESRQIRPLSAAAARRVESALIPLLDLKQQSLAVEMFEEMDTADASGDPRDVRAWLLGKVPTQARDVIVSWDSDVAVLSSIDVFCRYWDDFCYPGSDDVTIWAVTDEWAALYCHWERFIAGRRKHSM